MIDLIAQKFKEYGAVQEGKFKLKDNRETKRYYMMQELYKDPSVFYYLVKYFLYLHNLTKDNSAKQVIAVDTDSLIYAYEIARQIDAKLILNPKDKKNIEDSYLVQDVLETGGKIVAYNLEKVKKVYCIVDRTKGCMQDIQVYSLIKDPD